MKVSIHQPQYIPWIPYFLKIREADIFVILDTVDFSKNGVQNRNVIKTPSGKLWLTIPVKNKLGIPINQIEFADDFWIKKHVKSIFGNYKKSKYFEPFFTDFVSEIENKNVSFYELVTNITILILKYLNIKTKVLTASDLKVKGNSSTLILNINKQLNATEYISGIGGKNYLNEEEFRKEKIKIRYLEPQKPREYTQLFPKQGFFSDLSALDIIFNCGIEWEKYYD